MRDLRGYLGRLPRGKAVLWCYLIWYLVTVSHHFDGDKALWLNSLGISGVIGVALTLSVGQGDTPTTLNWQTFRLFLMPFCVSSFSSLIKGQGFILVFSPHLAELLTCIGCCAVFLGAVSAVKARAARADQASAQPAELDPS